jgi:hypothetical protein
LSYFSISFYLLFFLSLVPVDLMFITMSWIFFHYKSWRRNRKDVEGKRDHQKKRV